MVSDLGYAQFVWNGTRWRPPSGFIQIYLNGAQSAVTGTTTQTQLYALTIPGGLLGLNGKVHGKVFGAASGGTTAKNILLNIAGVSTQIGSYTTNQSVEIDFELVNRNSQTANAVRSLATTPTGSTVSLVNGVALSANTAIDQVLSIDGALTTSTDTIALYAADIYIKV
ncbi:hypothetical protein [uncultured Pseudacidovorax sp.]|uniref:hypothetical protein n=1 Tax=uncultured Pseudacidovorax sp. TaxID=679313 RepID=UPI0025E9C7D9|nr:hypothetical protein [uncultured Pseudacidovorax sp.]